MAASWDSDSLFVSCVISTFWIKASCHFGVIAKECQNATSANKWYVNSLRSSFRSFNIAVPWYQIRCQSAEEFYRQGKLRMQQLLLDSYFVASYLIAFGPGEELQGWQIIWWSNQNLGEFVSGLTVDQEPIKARCNKLAIFTKREQSRLYLRSSLSTFACSFPCWLTIVERCVFFVHVLAHCLPVCVRSGRKPCSPRFSSFPVESTTRLRPHVQLIQESTTCYELCSFHSGPVLLRIQDILAASVARFKQTSHWFSGYLFHCVKQKEVTQTNWHVACVALLYPVLCRPRRWIRRIAAI